MSRFKPTRAGIVNLWDYIDEEFVFADGRLALRGHNGSGKTKALEVLFPFVLDGSLSARRLDPFSGENRTMKSNLLYRGQDAAYGYVWMEFAHDGEPAEVVTLIIGLSGHKHREQVTPAYYVTGKRIGVDIGLLSADSRPLTANQLSAKLDVSECFKDRRGDYRDAVDARLFGLGTDRYIQLLDLLLSLRRPLLAKDLDPVKVSNTLSAGLSPVDEELVEQAARDFDNLAAVKRRFDDLSTASGAVEAFLAQYTAYVRAHTKSQLDRFDHLIGDAAGHAGAVRDAAAEVDRATRSEARAEQTRARCDRRRRELDAERGALVNSQAYKDHERLEQEREKVEKASRQLDKDRAQLAKDRRNINDLIGEADGLQDRAGQLDRAGEQHRRAILAAADAAALEWDPAVLEAQDHDRDTVVTALVASRRDDIEHVRTELGRVDEAEKERSRADKDLGKAREKAERLGAVVTETAGRLTTARTALSEALNAWTLRWADADVLTDGLPEALHTAAARIGEPDAASLEQTYTEATAGRRDELITRRETCKRNVSDLETVIQGLKSERTAVAEQRDEAPPGNDLRPADRADRPGAPLWQLVRFADHVHPEQAAAIEGALYGSGALTAWLHPDADLTRSAVAAAEADGYLIPLPQDHRPADATLADFLEPEHEQNLVAPETIRAILASIQVTDTPPKAGLAAVWITTSAQYGHGVQTGARPKTEPEFIGATARAARRRARLAEIDARMAELGATHEGLQAVLDKVLEAIENIENAAKLPPTGAVLTAVGDLATAAALHRDAEGVLRDASAALDVATAELSARQRTLRQVAGTRNMPHTTDEVDAVDQAVTDVQLTIEMLARDQSEARQVNTDLTTRRARIVELEGDYLEAATELAEQETEFEAAKAAWQTAKGSIDKEYEEILATITGLDAELGTVRTELARAENLKNTEHDNRIGATRDLDNRRTTLLAAMEALSEGADAFAPFAHPDLRDLLGVTESAHWPSSGRWIPASEAAERVETLLADPEPETDPDTAVRRIMPAESQTLLHAYRQATSGGRAVVQATLDTAGDRLTSAYQEFDRVLRGLEDGYEVTLGLGVPAMVDVTADDGRQPVARFAQRIAEEAQTQGVLLEEREHEVLEDTLLTALAQQIHHRVLAARDLVKEMDADTRAKPMSSGMAIGISWVRSDKISELQNAVATQLQHNTAALGADGLAQLRQRLREMIRDHKARNPRDTYRETLATVLDYRDWFMFAIQLIHPGGRTEQLTRKRHSSMSGGEKSAAIHLPLFAAANAIYSSAKPTCPRMVALDEAFAGIDGNFMPDLLGLTTKFDLDLFMTGHELWITTPAVPMIAHYDMMHDEHSQTVSSLLILWDGEQLIDAGAGFGGNDDIAAELLGFTPSRREPITGTDDGLLPPASEGDGEPETGDDL
ncbi:uncharacterized protein (TIGR02680 family) [Catenulispora sp. EB89]|uniref:TIGR02680 family protein n=1 Tax=Catenulispora sp. EB89 TaxID=3156257 RepID=UPI003518FB20